MPDNARVIARLPYPATVPKRYATASEVATMELARRRGVPVPRVLGYSTTSTENENDVGAEYILMEKVDGVEVAGVWYSMTDEQRRWVVEQVVRIEARLFDVALPACGSVYYARDLGPGMKRVELDGEEDGD